MAPPFEQTLITHAQGLGLFMCNISEFYSVFLEKKDFQRFCSKFYFVSIVFGYYFAENVGGATI